MIFKLSIIINNPNLLENFNIIIEYELYEFEVNVIFY